MDKPLKLVVFFRGKRLRTAGKRKELAADTFTVSIGIRTGAEVQDGDVIHVVLVKYGTAPHLVDLFGAGLIDSGTAAKGGRRRGGA